MRGYSIKDHSTVRDASLEITSEDGPYFNIDINRKDGTMELSCDNGLDSHDGGQNVDVCFTKEQAPEVIMALQALLGSI